MSGDWTVRLAGDDWSLQRLAGWFTRGEHRVQQEGGHCYLTSPDLTACRDEDEAWEVADRVIGLINVAARTYDRSFRTVRVEELIRIEPDGTRRGSVRPRVVGVEARYRVGAVVPRGEAPALFFPERLVVLQETEGADSAVSRALEQASLPERTPTSLNNILEIIRGDVSGGDTDKGRAWETMAGTLAPSMRMSGEQLDDELKRCRDSLQDPAAVGPQARHSGPGNLANPMTWTKRETSFAVSSSLGCRTSSERANAAMMPVEAIVQSAPEWWTWAFWTRDPAGIRDLVLIVGGFFGFLLLLWRTVSVHRQTNAALEQSRAALQQAETAARRHEGQADADRERRITDSFTRAVEQLGSDKLETRLGAIYALERIARESLTDHWPIMETLTAFVRERAALPWPDKRAVEALSKGQRGQRPPGDVQAALTVLGRRSRERDLGALGLSGTALQEPISRRLTWKMPTCQAITLRGRFWRVPTSKMHACRAPMRSKPSSTRPI